MHWTCCIFNARLAIFQVVPLPPFEPADNGPGVWCLGYDVFRAGSVAISLFLSLLLGSLNSCYTEVAGMQMNQAAQVAATCRPGCQRARVVSEAVEKNQIQGKNSACKMQLMKVQSSKGSCRSRVGANIEGKCWVWSEMELLCDSEYENHGVSVLRVQLLVCWVEIKVNIYMFIYLWMYTGELLYNEQRIVVKQTALLAFSIYLQRYFHKRKIFAFKK